MNVQRKIAVITGSSTGLGRALARVFHKLGATVVLNSNVENGLPELSQELGAKYFLADAAVESQMRDLANFVISECGRIDIWINNAGIWMPYMPMLEIPTSRMQTIMNVNFLGTWFGSHMALEQMQKQGQGVIVNIVSVRPLEPAAGSAAYASSKGAARALTQTLQLETAGTGISVLGVYPARMQTELFNEKKPEDFSNFMTADFVANKIVENIQSDNPNPEQIIKP